MDFGTYELTRALLKLGPSRTLKTLALVKSTLPNFAQTLIPSFGNLATLTYLSMFDDFFAVKNLEDIHAHLPLLETLEMSTLELNPHNLPRSIQPSTSLKSLVVYISHYTDPEVTIKWFRYMHQKYPSLENATTVIEGLEDDDVCRAFDTLLKQLGTQLKILNTVVEPNRKDVFKIMDKCGVQIQSLGMGALYSMNLLAASKQRNSLHTLQLFAIDFLNMQYLQALTKLKKLELSFKEERSYDGEREYYRINLDDLLEACPNTLETLHVQCAEMKWNFLGTSKQHTSLKSLTLNCIQFEDDGIDEYITKRLPSLDTLVFERNTMHSGNENLILPKHHFTYLSIDPVYNPRYADILVTTLDNHKQRFYSYERGVSFMNDTEKRGPFDIYFYETLKPERYINLETDHLITIICVSVTTLILDNKRAHQ